MIKWRKVLEKYWKSTGKYHKSIGNVSEQEKSIIEYIVKNNKIVSKTVEELLEVKEARARRILKEMTDKGYIIKQGQGRSTYYILKNQDEINIK